MCIRDSNIGLQATINDNASRERVTCRVKNVSHFAICFFTLLHIEQTAQTRIFDLKMRQPCQIRCHIKLHPAQACALLLQIRYIAKISADLFNRRPRRLCQALQGVNDNSNRLP